MAEQKENRPFQTLEELEEEYNETDHNFNDELKDVGRSLKEQIFSPWGALIIFAAIAAILSAVVR